MDSSAIDRTVRRVNENHAKLCASQEWADHLQQDVLPELAARAALGGDVLEIGPGPGAATEWLRGRVDRLTVVEIDEAAAKLLSERYAGTNVTVVCADATELDFPDGAFDCVGTFTMLHHVPTSHLQNKILAEAYRVLRPGGTLLGSDSLASDELHHFHAGDTYNPIDPGSLLGRLQALGCDWVNLDVSYLVKFVAHKPAAADETSAAVPNSAERTGDGTQ